MKKTNLKLSRFLTGWNVYTGRPTTEKPPKEQPLKYQRGDFFALTGFDALRKDSSRKFKRKDQPEFCTLYLPCGTEYTCNAEYIVDSPAVYHCMKTTNIESFPPYLYCYDGHKWVWFLPDNSSKGVLGTDE